MHIALLLHYFLWSLKQYGSNARMVAQSREVGVSATCAGSCSLLNPIGLDPLVEDVLHAAVLQNQSRQGVQRSQLLQGSFIGSVMGLGTASACMHHMYRQQVTKMVLSFKLVHASVDV